MFLKDYNFNKEESLSKKHLISHAVQYPYLAKVNTQP